MTLTTATAIAASDSIAFPTHATNDLIVVIAFRTAGTQVIAVPSDWLYVHQNGTSGQNRVIAFKYAASSSETSGTWTNAEFMCAIVASGTAGLVIPGDYTFAAGTSLTTASYSALAQLRRRDGESVVFGAAVTNQIDSSIETAPTGMVNRQSVLSAAGECALHETPAGVSSWATTNVSIGGTAGTVTRYTLELFENVASLGGGGTTIIVVED